jgi:hypothetical protein
MVFVKEHFNFNYINFPSKKEIARNNKIDKQVCKKICSEKDEPRIRVNFPVSKYVEIVLVFSF